MFKKQLLTAAIAIPAVGASLSASARTQQSSLPEVLQFPSTQGESLEEIRQRCIDLSANHQVNKFNIRILCNVEFEDIEKHQGEMQMALRSYASSQISMKGWQTQEQVSQGNPTQTIACNIYEKVRISGPEGGVPVSINNCEQINVEYLTNVCKAETKEVCSTGTIVSKSASQTQEQGQQGEQASQQQQQGPIGAQCTKETVEIINTCDRY